MLKAFTTFTSILFFFFNRIHVIYHFQSAPTEVFFTYYTEVHLLWRKPSSTIYLPKISFFVASTRFCVEKISVPCQVTITQYIHIKLFLEQRIDLLGLLVSFSSNSFFLYHVHFMEEKALSIK